MTWPMHDAGSTTPDPGPDDARRQEPPWPGEPPWPDEPRGQQPWPEEPGPGDDEPLRRGRHAVPDPLPPIEGPMPGGGPSPAETTLPLALKWPAPPTRPHRSPPPDPPGSAGAPPGWRRVPTDPTACGAEALKSIPVIEQVFVNCPVGLEEAAFNRLLYMARRLTEKALSADGAFYIPSLSASTIVFKGMVMPQYLAQFYPDLADPRLEASVAVFHQRFSTNTLPQWRLAHPFRLLAHNGEINTIEGNRQWAVARAPVLRSPLLARAV